MRPKVKAIYTLDGETVHALKRLAHRWNVTESEALRRVVRAAANQVPPQADAIKALEALQEKLRLSAGDVLRWENMMRDERRFSS